MCGGRCALIGGGRREEGGGEGMTFSGGFMDVGCFLVN